MQYQVPQFIETEDTIIGPVTVQQFVYMLIAGGISFVLYFFFTGFLWVATTIFLFLIAIIFGFVKYNGRPLTAIAFSIFRYFWKPRVYIWKRKEELEAMREREAAKKESMLQNLWLRVTTGKEIIGGREKMPPKSPGERYEVLRKTTGEREAVRRVDYR